MASRPMVAPRRTYSHTWMAVRRDDSARWEGLHGWSTPTSPNVAGAITPHQNHGVAVAPVIRSSCPARKSQALCGSGFGSGEAGNSVRASECPGQAGSICQAQRRWDSITPQYGTRTWCLNTRHERRAQDLPGSGRKIIGGGFAALS